MALVPCAGTRTCQVRLTDRVISLKGQLGAAQFTCRGRQPTGARPSNPDRGPGRRIANREVDWATPSREDGPGGPICVSGLWVLLNRKARLVGSAEMRRSYGRHHAGKWQQPQPSGFDQQQRSFLCAGAQKVINFGLEWRPSARILARSVHNSPSLLWAIPNGFLRGLPAEAEREAA